MFQLHVALDGQRDWWTILPPWIAAISATLMAGLIARSQNKLQRDLAAIQKELQEAQLDLQERELKRQLFEKRFAIFTKAGDFGNYALGTAGKIDLTGSEFHDFQEAIEEAEMLFGEDVHSYLNLLKSTALDLHLANDQMRQASMTGDVESTHRNFEILSNLQDVTLRRVEIFRPYLRMDQKEAAQSHVKRDR